MAKVVVIGTGAMGSIYATLMADAGHDVTAIDINREHVEAIRANGLWRISACTANWTVGSPSRRSSKAQ